MRFLAALEDLQERMRTAPDSDIASALDLLSNYAQEHFAAEEGLLRACGYPDYAEHRVEHEDYVQKIGDLREKLNGGRQDVARRIVNFMREWWVRHIMSSDRSYARFLQRKLGPTPP